jgi:putative two-component system response regulator
MSATVTPSNVLIVDDLPQNISLLNAALMDEYSVIVATGGRQAIDICHAMPVDIILLDVMMPELDGFQTCKILKNDPLTRSIPIIFVTALGESKDESEGFACGAVDFITKPIRESIVRARVKTHLALYDQSRELERQVQERTLELNQTRLEILARLGSAGEYRDGETGFHVLRVCHFSRIIATAYGLPASEADLLYNAAALHDTGKIGIPDSILFKPGKLDSDEWAIMRTHCEIGHNIIGTHQHRLLDAAAAIALTHHERWDGAGYPRGLQGSAIPLFGRIVAVVDVFDALTSVRPYKEAWPVAQAVAEIARCRGANFDPKVVDAFLSVLPELTEIYRRFRSAGMGLAAEGG